MAARNITNIIIDTITFKEIVEENSLIAFSAVEGNCEYSWESGSIYYEDLNKVVHYDEKSKEYATFSKNDSMKTADDIAIFSLRIKINQLKRMAKEVMNGQG